MTAQLVVALLFWAVEIHGGGSWEGTFHGACLIFCMHQMGSEIWGALSGDLLGSVQGWPYRALGIPPDSFPSPGSCTNLVLEEST